MKRCVLKKYLMKEMSIKTYGQIASEKYHKASRLKIHNRNLKQDLIRLGYAPLNIHKSESPEISDRCLSYFIRGFFEGDGSIHFNKPNTVKLRFTTTKYFILTLQSDLKAWKKAASWNCEYYGDNIRKLYHWMYRDCGELCLDRKRQRFVKHLYLGGKNGQTSYSG